MRAHQELLRDPLAYVSYIGRHDRQNTIDAFHEQGRDTVVRLCFTPSEPRVPLRLLGYIAAAQHITRTYLPAAQLQVIAPIYASARINGVPLEAAIPAAQRVFRDVESHPALQRSRPERTLFGFDTPGERLRPQAARIAPLTRHYPEARTLLASARARNTTYPAYVAAHLVMHDMVDSVIGEPQTQEQPDTAAQRVVSIGALSERAFYAARMRCRQAPLFETDDMVTTGQIFTRHVLPPYNFSRRPVDRPDPQLGSPFVANRELQAAVEWESQVIRTDGIGRDLAHLRAFVAHYTPEQEPGAHSA